MQKKTILFLDHTPFVGGAQLSLAQHLKAIDKNKFKVIIACSKKAHKLELTKKYAEAEVEYFLINFGRLKSFNPVVLFKFLSTIFQVRKIIKKEQIDLIVTNTVRAALAGSLAGCISKVNVIWLIRDFTFPIFFFKLFQVFPRKIIFNSNAVKNYFVKHLKIFSKAEVVYVGRDFYKKVKQVTNEQILKQRAEWKVNENDFLIGFVGRLVDWKGPQVLIKAINNLIKNGAKNIKCVIVGSGKGQENNNEKDLEQFVNKHNLNNNVIFTGYKKDICIMVKSLNALVLTSIEKEPFASTVIDAMMAKIPTIGTAIGGTPEIITNEETGLLVDPNNPEQLSKAILKLINSKSLRDRVVQNAYKKVMQNCDVKNTTKTLEDIYLYEN